MNTVIEGDLLDVTEGVLVHQVNCRQVMGAGLALRIRQAYPRAYDKYREAGTLWRPGMVQFVAVFPSLWVCNLAGQDRYGRDRQYTNYDAHREAWPKVNSFAFEARLKVYAPWKIGCGLGGGNWDTVRRIAEEGCPDLVWVRPKGVTT